MGHDTTALSQWHKSQKNGPHIEPWPGLKRGKSSVPPYVTLEMSCIVLIRWIALSHNVVRQEETVFGRLSWHRTMSIRLLTSRS